jgi:WD40 repeat protein
VLVAVSFAGLNFTEETMISDEKIIEARLYRPLLGHTNRINALVAVEHQQRLFSCSNDCTIRSWNTHKGYCDMVYQFSDPIYCALYDNSREMLFTGGWDRQLRAIDLKDNVVDQSFGASKEAIRTLHLSGKTLYIAGQEPVVRAFDLETAQIKEFKDQHTSWITCIATFPRFDDSGKPKSNWLLTGSDDCSVKIWDADKTTFLTELVGHKNGVTCITLANNELFTGSLDHYVRIWDIPSIDERLNELAMMAAEDIRGRIMRKLDRGKKKAKKGAKGGAKKKGKK